jgi:hypothetical protein
MAPRYGEPGWKSPHLHIYMARGQAEQLIRWIERQKFAGAQSNSVRMAIRRINEALSGDEGREAQ